MKWFIDNNFKVKRIRSLSSHISINIIIIFKKNSTADSRVIHDYRKFNERIIKNHTSLSHQDEILKLFINVIICEKIDLINAYYQILIYADDIYKTAFKTSFELYEWLIMFQKLCNVFTIFQRYMNHVFRKYIDKFCVVYQDDIIIFFNSVKKHK